MHFKANKEVVVKSSFSEEDILITKGETIHTKNLYKFDKTDIQCMGDYAGLTVNTIFSDKNQWLSLVHYKK